jgi:serine/threonine protein kinase
MYVIKKQGRRRNGSDDEVEFKLGDFGCARHVGSNGAANTFVGTSPYMAPEVTNHIPYATPADIWGVGCVIYELFNPKHTKYFAEIAEHNYRLHRRYRLASPPLITVWELPPNIITRRNGVEPRWMSLVRAACREEPYARPTASELLEKAHRLFDDYF